MKKSGKGGKAGLGLHSLTDKSTDSWNMGVKTIAKGEYPSVDRTESTKRSSTAPTPSTLGPRKG